MLLDLCLPIVANLGTFGEDLRPLSVWREGGLIDMGRYVATDSRVVILDPSAGLNSFRVCTIAPIIRDLPRRYSSRR